MTGLFHGRLIVIRVWQMYKSVIHVVVAMYTCISY